MSAFTFSIPDSKRLWVSAYKVLPKSQGSFPELWQIHAVRRWCWSSRSGRNPVKKHLLCRCCSTNPPDLGILLEGGDFRLVPLKKSADLLHCICFAWE